MNNNTSSLSLEDEEYDRAVAIYNANNKAKPVPKHVLYIVTIVVSIVLAGILSAFGVVANTINIIIFYRQGPMSSSPTVVLTGLAVSDLIMCVLGLIGVHFYIIEYFVGKIISGWYMQNLYVLCSSRPLTLMINVTCFFTTFLSVERAVSVTFPFKVKAIFTPRRTVAVLVSICVIVFVINFPTLSEYKPAWVRYPTMYPDRFRLVVPTNIFPQSIHDAYFIVGPIVLRFSSVFIVVLCNAIIFWKVKSSQRFRKSKTSTSTSTTTADVSSNTQEDTVNASAKETISKGNNPSSKDVKDIKLLRMITVVAGTFIFCYSFDIINTIMMGLVFTAHEDYHYTLGNLLGSVIMLMEYFNSCINAVIYFKMSTRYKQELLSLCRKKTS